jgi:hypothetical protein
MADLESAKIALPADEKWTAYNTKMAVLFAERDTHPVNSPARLVAAERILALWIRHLTRIKQLLSAMMRAPNPWAYL